MREVPANPDVLNCWTYSQESKLVKTLSIFQSPIQVSSSKIQNQPGNSDHHNTLHMKVVLKPPSSYLQLCHFQNPILLKSQFTLSHSPNSPLNPNLPISSSSSGKSFKPLTMAYSSPPQLSTTKPFSVLFVCLGNICRSPAAEGVFTHLVKQRSLEVNFNIDSAGTINYHEGGPADSRMRAASKRRGVAVTSISRPIRPSDFRDFDLILAMDLQNKDDILSAFERWSFKESFPVDAHKKVRLMCSYCKKHEETEVPDPYYGGPQGFEKLLLLFKRTYGGTSAHIVEVAISHGFERRVLDILEDACESLLDSIVAENSQIAESS